MNKNKTTSEKKSGWKWLLMLIRILQMLAWWNKKREPLATSDTCKTSPPREGSGEAPIAPLVSAISGPVSSTQSSKSQPLSSQASDCRASKMPSDGDDVNTLLSQLRSDCLASGRRIDLIVIHCSDTRPSQSFTIEQLRACHKARGFGEWPGYHIYIRRDGSLYYCRPVSIAGCHVRGWNAHSIGVCYEGGHSDSPEYKYEDNRTAEQLVVMDEVLRTLLQCYPDAELKGHNELAAKACPCFDVKTLPCYAEQRQ